MQGIFIYLRAFIKRSDRRYQAVLAYNSTSPLTIIVHSSYIYMHIQPKFALFYREYHKTIQNKLICMEQTS